MDAPAVILLLLSSRHGCCISYLGLGKCAPPFEQFLSSIFGAVARLAPVSDELARDARRYFLFGSTSTGLALGFAVVVLLALVALEAVFVLETRALAILYAVVSARSLLVQTGLHGISRISHPTAGSS